MPELTRSYLQTAEEIIHTSELPIGSIVRALCQAANAAPDLLYEVILNMRHLVESTAPM
jgi:hypothetical protein